MNNKIVGGGIILLLILSLGYWQNFSRPQVKFLLTSEGSTATSWLKEILNTFPEINCTQYNNVMIYNDYIKFDVIKFPLSEYFSIQKENAKPGARIYGNVHGYTLNILMEKHPDYKVKIANIIRHPISHIDSMYRFWSGSERLYSQIEEFIKEKEGRTFADYSSTVDHYHVPYREMLLYEYKLYQIYGVEVPNTLEAWNFLNILTRYDRVHANMLMADKYNIPQFKFEEFTTNNDALGALINYISNGTLKVSAQKLAALQQTPARRVNRQNKPSEQEIYTAWQSWQKKAFALHLSNIGGIKNSAYLQHGYDLSFVANE